MDFTASMAGGTSGSDEVMSLVDDVLRPFFQETFLLDFLVVDDGYPGKNLEFDVSVKGPNGSQPECFRIFYKKTNAEGVAADEDEELEACEELEAWWKDGSEQEHPLSADSSDGSQGGRNVLVKGDPLISVPGGIVGRHAIYAFLENAIRNSAKQGQSATGENGLEIRLAFSEADTECCCKSDDAGTFLLMRYSDNMSRSDKKNELNERLKEDVIKPTGEMTASNWGLQEMKAYASYLAGLSGNESEVNFQVNSDELDKTESRTEPALLWFGDDKCKGSLGGKNKLTLRLGLRKARLLLVVTPKEVDAGGDHKMWHAKGVFFTKADNSTPKQTLLAEIRRIRPYLLLLHAVTLEDANRYVEFVTRYHPGLPARLLISLPRQNGNQDPLHCLDEKMKQAWDNENPENGAGEKVHVNGWSVILKHSCITSMNPNGYPSLPTRRLFCTTTDLRIQERIGPEDSTRLHGQEDPIELFVIDCYSAYVKAFSTWRLNGHNEINLGMYFERDCKEVKRACEKWSNAKTGCLTINVHGSYGSKNSYMGLVYPKEPRPNDAKWIYFDNHNRGVRGQKLAEEVILFRQRIGGEGERLERLGNSDSIYRLLWNPPENKLAISLLLLGLVESSLSTIAVLDDRVSVSLYKRRDGKIEPRGEEIQKVGEFSGVWPVLWFCTERDKNYYCCFEGGSKISEKPVDGLYFLDGSAELCDPRGSHLPFLDTIVLHRGFMQNKISDMSSLVSALYGITGRVVWSTGRSRAGLGEVEEPVIEASALTPNLTHDFSKYHLHKRLASL